MSRILRLTLLLQVCWADQQSGSTQYNDAVIGDITIVATEAQRNHSLLAKENQQQNQEIKDIRQQVQEATVRDVVLAAACVLLIAGLLCMMWRLQRVERVTDVVTDGLIEAAWVATVDFVKAPSSVNLGENQNVKKLGHVFFGEHIRGSGKDTSSAGDYCSSILLLLFVSVLDEAGSFCTPDPIDNQDKEQRRRFRPLKRRLLLEFSKAKVADSDLDVAFKEAWKKIQTRMRAKHEVIKALVEFAKREKTRQPAEVWTLRTPTKMMTPAKLTPAPEAKVRSRR